MFGFITLLIVGVTCTRPLKGDYKWRYKPSCTHLRSAMNLQPVRVCSTKTSLVRLQDASDAVIQGLLLEASKEEATWFMQNSLQIFLRTQSSNAIFARNVVGALARHHQVIGVAVQELEFTIIQKT